MKALILSQQEQLSSHAAEIERLRLLIARLQRLQFGRKSEKVEKQIEQLQLQLDDLEESAAEKREQAESTLPPAAAAIFARVTQKPARRLLPDHLPRQTETHQPEQESCPACGGELSKLGEDVSEVLEYVPARFKVIRHVRPKLSCTKCDVIVQAQAPSRPIDRGLAGPGLLAHVLVSKYADHLPLYRQAEIYAREGVELERSTLADWVGATSQLLTPLHDALRQYVMRASKLHADDTPVPVLAPGTGKPNSAVCGRMFEMIGRPAMWVLRRFGLFTRQIEKESIHTGIWPPSAAHCKPTVTPGSIDSMMAVVFKRLHAGLTFAASFLTCIRHTPLRLRVKRSSVLASSIPSKAKSAVALLASVKKCAMHAHGLY